VPVLVGAIAIVGIGLWFAGIIPPGGQDETAAPASSAQSSTSQGHAQTLPQFLVAAAPRVRAAYDFASGHGDELAYIPCYCGCGEHSGHRNVRDCFIKQQTTSNTTYDDHGAGCDICVSIVLDVETQLGEGQPLAAVSSYIDGKYAKYGPGTDTPLPTEMEE
jgi:hypothetical protein